MMMDSNYNKYTTSMILEAGNEYFIDVTPKGQISTEGFKNLNFQQRQCHLETEVVTAAAAGDDLLKVCVCVVSLLRVLKMLSILRQ